MPIYEYQCDACKHAFDVLQKMSDAPLADCPECGEPRLRKLISAPNFRLKGAGWYETDFKDKNQRNLAGGSDASGGDSKASSKSDGGADKGKAKTDTSASKSTDGAKTGGDKASKAKPASKSSGSASSE